jgi:hypothetical protein
MDGESNTRCGDAKIPPFLQRILYPFPRLAYKPLLWFPHQSFSVEGPRFLQRRNQFPVAPTSISTLIRAMGGQKLELIRNPR